jgi:hypothetical protein
MIAYSTGVPNLLASDGPRSIVRSWRATRGWFGAQLMVCAVLLLTAWISKAGVVGTYASWMSAIPQWLGRPLLWILFVAPYAHLLLSLRRSLRFYARRGGATRRMA